MSGVPDDWAARNGITPRLAFSHHLAAVFPPSLYAEHPEFFPLIDGKRLQPPAGSGFWNPDIAREDAARYAAEAARKYFAANPNTVSFALGVNDALIWGESPELRALTRDQRTEVGARRAEDSASVGPALPAGPGNRRESGLESGAATSAGPTIEPGLQIPASDLRAPASGSAHQRWHRDRPDYSNLVFTFMNRAAEELAKTHPDKYLGALAYYWTENVPDFPLHPQVVPFLTADRAQGYDAGFKREELELQARWGRLAGGQRTDDGSPVGPALVAAPQNRNDIPTRSGTAASAGPTTEPGSPNRTSAPSLRASAPPPSGIPPLRRSAPPNRRRLGMYDYLYGGGFLIPRIHTRLLAENLQHARRVGFTDYYAEVYANWGLDGPMPWLTAQLIQDPEQPLEPLLDEYYTRYFREAAGPMRKFFERCEELWMAQPGPPYWLKHFRNQSQAVIFPEAARRELRGLIDEARRQAWFGRTRARVAQVSAAFGVTERFTTFYEARERLKSLAFTATAAEALSPREAGRDVSVALAEYLETRRDFIEFTTALQKSDPLAVRKFGWDDYLKDDPVPLALVAIARLGHLRDGEKEFPNSIPALTRRATAEGNASTARDRSPVGPPLAGAPPGRSATPSANSPGVGPALVAVPPNQKEISSRSGAAASAGPTILDEPNVAGLWAAISSEDAAVPPLTQRATSEMPRGPARERREGEVSRPPATQLLRNAAMSGPLTPARTIAGLPYGVELPAEWQSKVEPAEFHRAELVEVGPERAVRISGTKDTTISQWVAMPARKEGESALQRAAIAVRGKVSPGTAVQLVFSWLDAKERHVGFKTVRLPDGEWPEWVTLRQAGEPPAGAAWVGLGLRVQNQVEGDWVEAKGWGVRSGF